MNKAKKVTASSLKKISRKKKKQLEKNQQPVQQAEVSLPDSFGDGQEVDPTADVEQNIPEVTAPVEITADTSAPTPQGQPAKPVPQKIQFQKQQIKSLTILGKSIELQSLIALIVLPLIVFAIYSNTYNVEFLYDDEKEIELARELHITKFTFEKVKTAFTKSHRPVAKLSFAVNYYYDRLNTRYYHLVNILIHITNGILLYFFIKITMSLPAVRNRRGPPGWIPFMAALLWIVNPTHIQSVTYVVQRMNSMSAMFYLITLLLYVKARQLHNIKIQWPLYLGCIITTILALGSKEIAGTIPLIIFLYEWYFFQDLNMSWLKKRIPFIIGALILFLAVGLYYLGLDPMAKLQAKYERTPFTMGQRVLTEWRVVMFYISQIFFPHPSQFNILHAFPLSTSFFAPITTFFSFLAIVLSLVIAFISAQKRRLISFCILWFLGNLAIESTVIGLEIIYEHRSYLPSMFLILLTVLLGQVVIKNDIAKKITLAVMIATCCFWTYNRNATWANEINFWHDTINKNPKASRAYNDLANAYAVKGQKKKAVEIYYQGLKLNYSDWKMHFNLGVILASLWESEKAIEQFKWVIKARPNFADAHQQIGLIYARNKNFTKAVWHTTEAIRLDPAGMQAARRNLVTYKKWAQTGGPTRRR